MKIIITGGAGFIGSHLAEDLIKKRNIKKIIIIDDFKEKLFNVENIKKPIKSISAYKAQEIRDICHTLNINAMKTPTKYKTKKDLYQLICETIM